MTTISKLAYQIVAETEGFTKGLTLSRNELALSRKVLRESIDPITAYEAELKALGQLLEKGALSTDQHKAAVDRLKAAQPDAIANTKRLADETARAKQITDQVRTPTERYQKEIAELNKLLKAGKISQDTHSRAVTQAGTKYGQSSKSAADLAAKTKQAGMSAAGSIPGIGGMTRVLSAGHPVLMAVAVAAAAVTVAIKLGKKAFDTYTSAVSEAFEEIDKLAKQGRVLGTTAQELRELRYAAGQMSTVEVSAFDQALTKLQKNMADAANGTGRAQTAFAALGLDAAKLRDAGTSEAMRMIADAMQGIENPADRVNAAMRIFGDQGANLVPMLAGGRAAIDAEAASVRALAGDISAMDAAGIEAMNDSWADVKLTLSGIAEQAAADLAPTLQMVAEELIELLKPGSQFGETLRFSLEAIPPVLAWIIDESNKMIGTFEVGQSTVTQTVNLLVQAAATADRVLSSLVPGREANAELQFFAEDYARQMQLAGDEAGKRLMSGLAGEASKKVEEIRKRTRDNLANGSGDGVADGDAAAVAAADAIDKLTQSLEKQIATAGMSADQIQRWKLAQEGATEETLVGVAALQRQAAAAKAGHDLRNAIEKTTGKLREQIRTTGLSADQLQLWKLRQQGASQAALRHVHVMQQQAAAQKQQLAAADAVAKLTRSLEEQVATAGLSADQLQLWKLRQQGASQAALRHVHVMQQQAAAQKKHADMVRRATQIREGNASPAERYAAEFRPLFELLRAGMITLEDFHRERRKLESPIKVNYTSAGIEGVAADSKAATMQLRDDRQRLVAARARQQIEGAVVAEATGRRPRDAQPQPNYTAVFTRMAETLARIDANTTRTADRRPLEIEEVRI